MTAPAPFVPLKAPSLAELQVLVVDDQANALNLIKDMLKSMGVQSVFTAAEAAGALELLKERQDLVDVVLCDWSMPEMSGLELLREVRKTHKDLPFIMVTGTADPSSVLAAKDGGVSGYIKKPFSSEELRKKMSSVARVKAYRS
ncbi:MAG TPA: response regulator [Caulobacteraceae bacterium]|jgi:two-component system chemotaxis response regulator CheY